MNILSLLVLFSFSIIALEKAQAQDSGSSGEKFNKIEAAVAQFESFVGISIQDYIDESMLSESDSSVETGLVDISSKTSSIESLSEEGKLEIIFEPFNVDYGYLVRDSSGMILDTFGPDTPIRMSSQNELLIEGYEAPINSSIVRVGSGGYNEGLLEVVKRKHLEIQGDKVNKQVSDVSVRATRATYIIASQMCVSPVFPSVVKLYMSAGFDFVVLKSDTGSELTVNMDDICEDFYLFIVDEYNKLGGEDLVIRE